MKQETKVCTKCKEEKPKNKRYFYVKPKNKTGKRTTEFYKSACKECINNQNKVNTIKRRCNEEGIDISEWEDFKKEQRQKIIKTHSIFQLKNQELKSVPRNVRARIYRKEREEGYVFTTYEQYKKDCIKNKSECQRKYDYGDVIKIPNNSATRILADYYIANRLGGKLNEIPKEFIETKRLIIQLKRELQNGK